MLFDIHKGEWDDELLLLFDIPKAILPHVTDSFGELGVTDHEVFGATVPIRGVPGTSRPRWLAKPASSPA